jgi:hypothetical protein
MMGRELGTCALHRGQRKKSRWGGSPTEGFGGGATKVIGEAP